MSLAPGAPGFRRTGPAGWARRPGRAALAGAAEAAARGGGEARTEGAPVLGGAALSLGFVLGALRGESVVATPRKRPTMSVVGGGGGGG